MLGEIRKKADPAETGTEVKAIRRTGTGEVLVELGPNTKDKAAFAETIRGILGENAAVSSLNRQKTVEIRDLDELATPEEVTEAIKRDLKDLAGDLRVSVTKANSRALKMAIVTLDEAAANELLQSQHIKIGWVNCRVRRRIDVQRCYKCLGYGHTRRECKGPERRDLCWRCGQNGHKAGNCESSPRCVLCAGREDARRSDHVPGSGTCKTYRDALEAEKRKKSQR